MPKLIPSQRFLDDIEALKFQKVIVKKIAKALAFLEANPHHPGLHLERIINDPSAWSIRVDSRYRISFDPGALLPSGSPDWSGHVTLLRILAHDDLYRRPR